MFRHHFLVESRPFSFSPLGAVSELCRGCIQLVSGLYRGCIGVYRGCIGAVLGLYWVVALRRALRRRNSRNSVEMLVLHRGILL